MEKTEAHRRIEKLRFEINHHRYRYHAEDAPEISDEAYDSLMRELEKLEGEVSRPENPDEPNRSSGRRTAQKF